MYSLIFSAILSSIHSNKVSQKIWLHDISEGTEGQIYGSGRDLPLTEWPKKYTNEKSAKKKLDSLKGFNW